jgi:hypothetical protein
VTDFRPASLAGPKRFSRIHWPRWDVVVLEATAWSEAR